MTTLERALARLDASGDCWLWTGATSHNGYGTIDKGRPVHRVIWEGLVGPVPPGHQLDHLCRVRTCANTAHLRVVTPKENTRTSQSFAGKNARKTHCPRGHTYDVTNSQGRRTCRTCTYQAQNRRRAR